LDLKNYNFFSMLLLSHKNQDSIFYVEEIKHTKFTGVKEALLPPQKTLTYFNSIAL